MIVRLATLEDHDPLVDMIANFRVTLSQFRARPKVANYTEAEEELSGYQSDKHRVFVAQDKDRAFCGYMICRIEGDVVWAESMFVVPQYRRQGVASKLYDEAENLVRDVGGDTVYNWVDPNNERIISFLRNRNYTVLNLIELRRVRSEEKPVRRIKVGRNSFDY